MAYKIHTHKKTLLADLQTPVGIYLKVRDIYPQSALLESSDFHSNENSYSYVGIDPVASFTVEQGVITEKFPTGEERRYALSGSDCLTNCFNCYLHQFSVSDTNNINGFFGYTAYNAIRYFEPVESIKNPTKSSVVPEMYYILYRFVIAVNHFKNELTIVQNRFEGDSDNIAEIQALLENRDFASYDFTPKGAEYTNVTTEMHREMIQKGIKHCLRGDVFQIVLSRCFMQDFSGDDFKVYRALRSVNPSPYLFYFDFGAFRIFGSSPETHCRINKGNAYIDPIAGTVHRTGDDEKDKELADKLINDPKENAEHVMLVDLARNDLSRNAHNVKLDFYKEVQYYSHVIHLVSRVKGDLPTDANPVKVFADTFPAGTLSGAPKVRAMQLISEIEGYDRGAYGGCIGYVGLNGEMNQAIAIRTFVSKGNTLYYQAGGGIVSKSDVELEVQEVNNKLGALKKAIDMANSLKN
jgi:Anthranilate/para-aminobenzoate synthases component I